MTYVLGFALLSLFTPFKVLTPIVQVRPFDALTGLALLWAFAHGKAFPRGGPQLGVLVMLPYFAWHVVSALGVSPTNGIREGLQLATVVAFVWAVSVEMDDLDYRRLGNLLLVGMIAITIWSIGWHISNGFWSGWKRLLDPKATFTFLPLVLGCMLVASDGARRRLLWFGWIVLGAVIFLSGERKALIVFGVLSAVLVARGRLLSSLHVVAGSFVVLVMLSDLVEDPYLSRQIQSVIDPVETGDFSTAIATGEAASGDTRSNAQRGFAIALAQQLISENFVFGVGTNAYEKIIQTRFGYLPEFLQSGIHGEFLRVMTENGVVGLVFYVLIWVTAIIRTRGVLSRAVQQNLLNASQASLLQIITAVPCLLYISFEGSGTHSLVVLAFASLLPDGLRAWLEPIPRRVVLPTLRSNTQPPVPRSPTPARWRSNLGTSS
jgi:hypothetical protein